MNVLILGNDPTIFQTGDGVFGDARARHVQYAARLNERRPGSTIRIISYAPASAGHLTQRLGDDLSLYPTNSKHRATFALDLFRTARTVLNGWRPDLVTSQSPFEEGLVGHSVARRVAAKFLLQIHFDFFSDAWLCESPLNRFRRRSGIFLVRRADRVRVVSQSVKNRLVQSMGLPEGRVCVVPVFLTFAPVDRGMVGDRCKTTIHPDIVGRPVVLFVGRFYPPKNLPLWIEVAEIVADRVPEARFVLAGTGPGLDQARTLVRGRGLEHRFHFLGKVGHKRLPVVYGASDLVLMTSNHEGMPLVLLEAYLSGIPVVSTRTSGPQEVIQDGQTGFLSPVGDSPALADSVVRLLRDRERARQMGEKGRELVRQRYDPDRLIDDLLACWERTVEGTR